MEKKEKKIIKPQGKNECIIHQNTARMRGTLTPTQSKSMLAILKRANEEVSINPNLEKFEIPTSTFIKDIQLKDTASLSVVLNKLQKDLRVLMTKTFEWGTPLERNMCVFMQEVKIDKERVTFKFSDYIREHIKPLSNALILKDFELIQSFKSEYARQLYKHIMMWEKRGTLELSIKDFKDFLGVPNTSSYERLDVIKRKVLNVAIKEINSKCPEMKLSYINLTEGKKVVGFGFGWFFVKEAKSTISDGSDLKTEFIEYIGKFLGKDKNSKILCITPYDKPQRYRVDTPSGEYQFPNIEALRNEIKKFNNSDAQ